MPLALPGAPTEASQAGRTVGTAVVAVADVVALAIGTRAPSAPASDSAAVLVDICRRISHGCQSGARDRHAQTISVLVPLTLPRGPTEARQAGRTVGATIIQVADIVALAVGARAPSTPASGTAAVLIYVVRSVVRAARGQPLPKVVCSVLVTAIGIQPFRQPAEIGIAVKHKLPHHHHSFTFSFGLAGLLAIFKEEPPRERALSGESKRTLSIIAIEALMMHPDWVR
mmetsp:Transcript_130987/g.318248  ORF Transcript_130987/g.318248 Transcript_130987/m.318248 type:complete len:228 (+) Transcript_130987:548-1231(+)